MRTILSALNKKKLRNSVHYEQSYRRSCWPTLSRQCAFGVCQCIWVQAMWLWCRGNFPPNFPQLDLGRRADSRWALPQISSLFFFFTREISEMRGPTGMIFCMMVSNRPYFIMSVQNFWGHTPKKFQGSKPSKIWPDFGRLRSLAANISETDNDF